MNVRRSIFASVGIALVFAAVSFAEQVKTDYDRSANFGQYLAYSWETVQTQDQLWVGRIKDAVNAAQTGEGLDTGGIGRSGGDRSDGDD
jgi:hypothetical protein